MNERLRLFLGGAILFFAFFYNSVVDNAIEPKLEKPSEEIIALIDDFIDITDPNDSAKLSGTFNAMSEKINDSNINTNLQAQYFFDYVGKKIFKGGINKKYPDFGKSMALLMTKVIGPQTEEEPISEIERKGLSDLLYGLSWKLYENDLENVFDEYKSLTFSAISEYNKDDDADEDEVEKNCPCEGKGYIVQGDGHVTDCPCIDGGGECPHDPKCGSVKEPEQPKSRINVDIPDIVGYRPKVGVVGMSVRYHLVHGAVGQHDALPAEFVDSLTVNQQYWLHDFLHGYNSTTATAKYGIDGNVYTYSRQDYTYRSNLLARLPFIRRLVK